MFVPLSGQVRPAAAFRVLCCAIGLVTLASCDEAPRDEPARLEPVSTAASGADEPGLVPHGPAKIVGGDVAAEGDWPFLVYAGGCGGTLISPDWVLTAAHCGSLFSNGRSVNIGGYRVSDMNDGLSGEWRTVERRECHPYYSRSGQDYDICLVKLATPSSMEPLPIDTSTSTHAGDPARVAGWGTLSSGGSSPDVLREAVVPVVTNNTCREPYGDDITSRMMCAGYAQGGVDSCQGDSGGPLVRSDGETLIGVVSWGSGCARPGYYGVYARVASVVDWICDTTGGAAYGCAGGGGPSGNDDGQCMAAKPEWIGDGYCDGGAYNTEACGFDGGDCCEQTCTDGDRFTCGHNGFECKDPAGASACTVAQSDWLGDGYCDAATDHNTAACGFDGGDCCQSTCNDGAAYDCGANGYECVDPTGW